MKIMATSESKPSGCPVCGASAVAEILYALPAVDDELARALDAGHVVLGGCCVWDGMPQWRCGNCSYEWGEITLGETNETEF